MWAVKCSPRWHIPPPGRAAGVASPAPRSRRIRISRGEGLARDCSNPADTTPANSQLPNSLPLPPPKIPHGRDGAAETPPGHRGTVCCCSIPGQPAGPRGGQGSIVPGAERGLLPALLEHGALRLTWPPQGKFQNFPSWDHMNRARRAGQVGASEPRCLTHAVPVNPHRAARDGGLAPGGSGTDPDPPPPTPARRPWCSSRGRSGMRLPRVSLRVLAARGSVLWLISSAS